MQMDLQQIEKLQYF